MCKSTPTTLVCTVGTSLEGNLKRFNAKEYEKSIPKEEYEDLKKLHTKLKDEEILKNLELINTNYEKKDLLNLGKALIFLPPSFRLLGAEINSILAMKEKGIINTPLERLVLLVSDTESGQEMGELLKHYFLNKDNSLRCENISVEIIEDLKDKEPRIFQRKGLPNLVRMLGKLTEQWSSYAMAINATGGYKAQIAFAVVFGQAMSIPVYYKHELFNEIISFPSVPFTIDLELMKNNLNFWATLAEENATLSYNELEKLGLPENWDSILPLLETIDEDGKEYYALSTLGLIYWEAFYAQNPNLELEPARADSNSGCNLPDHNYARGFREWAERLNANKKYFFISGCHSIAYSKQKISETTFEKGEKQGEIIATYGSQDFSPRLRVLTTCKNELERNYVLQVLREEIKK